MFRNTFFIIAFLLFVTNYPAHSASDDSPQRIVSLGPINTENVFLLGAGDRLVANTNYCVRPDAAKEKEKIGSVMQISIEKIIGLRPDLVLATGLTQIQQVRQLESVGIRVVQFKQPASFTDICNQFIKLGILLGLEKKARKIVAESEKKVVAVQKATAGLPVKKVFLQVGSLPLFGSVPGSFTNDFIIMAGGSNIISNQKRGTTSYEKVITANPDVIIIAIMGSETGIAAKEKKKWMNIPVINAVTNKQVYLISPDLACSPSPPTFAHTLTLIADMLHNELNTN